jgi:hypothetical protein
MIIDSDIVFVTTSMSTKWIGYQQKILNANFPKSTFVVVSGIGNWPKSWFYWIDQIKNLDKKWYIHIDEDCFLESREEVLKLLEKMDAEDIGISAISEAYCHFRGNNPVAFNSFFLVGRIQDLKDINIDLNCINFTYDGNKWSNSMGLHFKEEYKEGFEYVHEKAWPYENYDIEAEPYYLFCWLMKEKKIKFYYLYPYFDDRFKSTNPRIEKDSPDIAIHMWYTRMWDSQMDVHGLPNSVRYSRLENYLKEKGSI